MEEDMTSRSHPYADAPSAPLKPSEVLEKAAALIEPEGAWTQGAFARTATGHSASSTPDLASCWCAMGAIDTAYAGPGYGWAPYEILDYLSRAADPEGAVGVASWNDDPARTQAEVVAALRKAAELARSEGA